MGADDSKTPPASRRGMLIAAGLVCAAVFATIFYWGLSEAPGDRPGETRTVGTVAPVNGGLDPADLVAGPPPEHPEEALLGTDSSLSTAEQQLVLVATRPGRAAGTGTARIGTDPRNPQTYAAGAQLANGTVLREVHDGYVVLDRGGRRSLLLVAGRDVQMPAEHRDIGTDSSILAVGGEEAVNRPLDKLATSREDLSEIIRAEPFFERDELAGLKIVPGIHGHKLALLELQAGDIVRTIEGKRIKSADAAWQSLDDAISSNSSLLIGVEREGAMLSMSLDGSRLAETQIPPTLEHGPGAPGS